VCPHVKDDQPPTLFLRLTGDARRRHNRVHSSQLLQPDSSTNYFVAAAGFDHEACKLKPQSQQYIHRLQARLNHPKHSGWMNQNSDPEVQFTRFLKWSGSRLLTLSWSVSHYPELEWMIHNFGDTSITREKLGICSWRRCRWKQHAKWVRRSISSTRWYGYISHKPVDSN